jgi:hypothetical protein
MKSVNFSLTVFISGVVVMDVLMALVVMAVLVVLVKIAVLAVLVMRAVLDVLVVTGSSCFANMTTTPMGVPNATNTNDAIPIIMIFPHFTVQPASESLSSSSSS